MDSPTITDTILMHLVTATTMTDGPGRIMVGTARFTIIIAGMGRADTTGILHMDGGRMFTMDPITS